MRIKFWGTRGSIPTPEPDCCKYGGDTSCVEVRSGDTLLILDAGTGIRKLGQSLAKDPTFTGKGYVFLTHSHWDHIQGFPFFGAAFVPGSEFFIHGAFKADRRLEDSLRGQMGSIYFPISMNDMPGSFHFVELIEQDIMAGQLMVRARALNHPGGCFGYRITDGKHTVAYCTDTEPYPDKVDEKCLELAKDADVLIYDAQFTPEEYARGKKGWGHSTWQEGIKIAHEANARRLILFHHDPYHNDKVIDSLVEEARIFFPNTLGATREMELDLGTATVQRPQLHQEPRPSASSQSRPPSGASGELRLSPRLLGDCVVFNAPRDLSIFNSEAFQEQVSSRIDPAKVRRVLLNMAGLAYIDSSGIGSLAAVNDFCRRNDLKLGLYGVSAQILDVLKVTRINLIIDLYRTEQHALDGGPKVS